MTRSLPSLCSLYTLAHRVLNGRQHGVGDGCGASFRVEDLDENPSKPYFLSLENGGGVAALQG